jgi:hypothetical protein
LVSLFASRSEADLILQNPASVIHQQSLSLSLLSNLRQAVLNMVAFKSFAVLGAGTLGSHIINELLKAKVSVKVLTRDDTKVPMLFAFTTDSVWLSTAL